MTAVSVRALRRYPVKSMGGEALDRVDLEGRGLVGDRWYAVVDADGRLASGKDSRRFRRRDAVFAYAASTDSGGSVVVSRDAVSWTVGDAALDAELSTAMGTPVQVLPEAGVPHQDGAAVSLVGTASLRWCAERWGGSADVRRTRTNLLLETEEPFVEDGWVGRELALGSARFRVVETTPRCRMVDLDQDGVRTGVPWLQRLGAERGLDLAVYAEVVQEGTISVDDVVHLDEAARWPSG